MRRRFAAAALAAVTAAPAFSAGPAAAAVLFSCVSASGSTSMTPGLGHNQTAQTASALASIGSCSNGRTGSIGLGAGAGLEVVASFPSRPLGCPEAGGGAGPDYADQTPLLLGNDPSFSIAWDVGGSSTGIAKVKSAGPVDFTTVKIVLSITAGQFAPPVGQKTKVKGPVTLAPADSFTCADDSDPISSFTFVNSDSLIVKQA
jgi:hypothetical protein